MADTDAARIGDVKGGLAAARADTATRMKRDGSNVNMTSGEAAAFRVAIGAGGGGGSGDVVGPASVTADALAQFDGTTGKLLKGGPMLGVAAAGSVLRRSDGDGRYQPLATGLTALAVLATPGIYYLSAPGVWSAVTIGTNLTFTGGTLSASGGGGTGNVVGPASATNNAVALFDGTTGKLLSNGPNIGVAAAGDLLRRSDGDGRYLQATTMAALKPPEFFTVAVSDEATAITTGTAKITFRMPYGFTLTGVRASLTTASTSGLPQVGIKENGTTILSTNITLDVSEKTSTTAATPPVISDASLADDAEITIDIVAAGTGAKGLKVTFLGART